MTPLRTWLSAPDRTGVWTHSEQLRAGLYGLAVVLVAVGIVGWA